MYKAFAILLTIICFAYTGCMRAEPSETPGEHKNVFTVPSNDIPRLNYLLSLPKDYSASDDPWPLIVFLHGGGERGNNLDKLKVHGPPKIADRNKDFPFVVLSPQCPSGSRWTYEIKTVKSLLDNILDNYNVDPGRVYLTGLSLGGYGTWNMAMMYPEYFAAIAPMCGGGIVDEAHNLRNMPVWVFHGAKDNSNPLENNQRMVDAVKAAGGDVKFTIYPNIGHDCWTASYNNQELYDWFLSHRKVGRR